MKMQTRLKDVVVLEPLCESDLLGDRDRVSEVFVWEFVHLDGVIYMALRSAECLCYRSDYLLG